MKDLNALPLLPCGTLGMFKRQSDKEREMEQERLKQAALAVGRKMQFLSQYHHPSQYYHPNLEIIEQVERWQLERRLLSDVQATVREAKNAMLRVCGAPVPHTITFGSFDNVVKRHHSALYEAMFPDK